MAAKFFGEDKKEKCQDYVESVFKEYDTDESGELSYEEAREFLKCIMKYLDDSGELTMEAKEAFNEMLAEEEEELAAAAAEAAGNGDGEIIEEIIEAKTSAVNEAVMDDVEEPAGDFEAPTLPIKEAEPVQMVNPIPVGPDGKPNLGTFGELLDGENKQVTGVKGCILGPEGKPLAQSNDTKTGKPLGFPDEKDGRKRRPLGKFTELRGSDGLSIKGEFGEILGADGNSILGKFGELKCDRGIPDWDGVKVGSKWAKALLGKFGQIIGPDGKSILGVPPNPKGCLLGWDGKPLKPLMGEDGLPLKGKKIAGIGGDGGKKKEVDDSTRNKNEASRGREWKHGLETNNQKDNLRKPAAKKNWDIKKADKNDGFCPLLRIWRPVTTMMNTEALPKKVKKCNYKWVRDPETDQWVNIARIGQTLRAA